MYWTCLMNEHNHSNRVTCWFTESLRANQNLWSRPGHLHFKTSPPMGRGQCCTIKPMSALGGEEERWFSSQTQSLRWGELVSGTKRGAEALTLPSTWVWVLLLLPHLLIFFLECQGRLLCSEGLHILDILNKAYFFYFQYNKKTSSQTSTPNQLH